MMSKLSRILFCLVTFAGLVLIPAAAQANASAAPFTDEYANGTLTLCNRNNQPVTAGSLLNFPFVWKAVSSTPAPAGYKLAYLSVYQPIQHVDPANWMGYQLTDQALFSNPAHPVAQATGADSALYYADHAFPPYWDGLYELRMYFSSPDIEPYSSPYPMAIIRVSGNDWKLVSGGNAACNVGTAVSVELSRLPKSETDASGSIRLGAKSTGSTASRQTSSPSSAGGLHSTSTSVVPTDREPDDGLLRLQPPSVGLGRAAGRRIGRQRLVRRAHCAHRGWRTGGPRQWGRSVPEAQASDPGVDGSRRQDKQMATRW